MNGRSPRRIIQLAAMIITLYFIGCDDEPDDESGVPSNSSQPGQRDLAQAAQIADAASANSIVPRSNVATTAQGNGDLGVLGGDANQNQQAFREKYDLPIRPRISCRNGTNTTQDLRPIRTRTRIGNIPLPPRRTGWEPPGQTAIHLQLKELRCRWTSAGFRAVPSSTFPR